MVPKGITNKTQEITDDQMSISYQTDKNRQTSCEEQAALLVKDGWVALYETPYDDDYGWSQTFTQSDTSLSLDCTGKDTKNTNVELYEYPSREEY